MKLIADSGSTKTKWALTENGQVKSVVATKGLNPYFHSISSVEALILSELVPFIPGDNIEEIHFYGAGCSTEYNDKMISDALSKYFPKAGISIYHDILGAARALFGRNPGIAGILGTGCNSCYYDGKISYQEVDSLGYLFGDEGAGSNLGKTWMGLYLKGKVPADLKTEFDNTFHFTLEDILNALYNRPYPNRFLASFSEFLAPRQGHPFIRSLVKKSFEDFVSEQLNHYQKYQPVPVSLVGSVAYFYQDILKEVIVNHGFTLGSIQKDPLEGLIAFHE